jgi:primosomal protein N' (replication factor Y)
MSVVLRVGVPVPMPQIFDYLPPDGPIPEQVAGLRVRVPFGRRELVGVVLGTHEAGTDPRQLRAALAWLDDAPPLPEELLRTLTWAAGYYAHPIGEVLATALPGALREGRATTRAAAECVEISLAGRDALSRGEPRAGSRLRALLEWLAVSPRSLLDIEHWHERANAALRTLRERDWVQSHKPTGPDRPVAEHAPEAGPALNADQRVAADAIATNLGRFGVYVLEGVTGSGKTEVYLSAAAAALAAGKQCLILVPEIGLTPQALQRYQSRLGHAVYAFHSGLSDGARAATWLAVAQGSARVIVGTRSAVFAPTRELGLVVVDEEHDASYKQQEGFRYHARDLAVMRAHTLNVPIVLGSATPALETLANVQAGRYALLALRERAGGARAPRVRMLDLRNQKLQEGLSQPLIDALRATTARGEHALVFRNRRGYAPLLLCHACGWHAACPRCDATLTVHRGAQTLQCHHCGHRARLPVQCPSCKSSDLLALGAGTERLEAALAERLPGVRIVRIDRDTTRRRGAFARLLDLPNEEGAVLVGTQMLAKGHDLPNLTLTAIVNVDEGLFAADVRGAERLAQLIVQVSGRAGRGQKPGEVWLQTHHPDHALLRTLLSGGYRAFAESELAERKALALPPYAHWAVLRAQAPRADDALRFLDEAKSALSAAEAVRLRGPMPAPMAKRAGMQRAQLLLEADTRAALHAALTPMLRQLYALRSARQVRWSLDVDPVDLY